MRAIAWLAAAVGGLALASPAAASPDAPPASIIGGTATISTSSLSGTLDGSLWIADCPYGFCGQIVAACTSPSHQFKLSR